MSRKRSLTPGLSSLSSPFLAWSINLGYEERKILGKREIENEIIIIPHYLRSKIVFCDS